jgi:catechol 2,3-dioxygenase-like lactoylglutathione lyase family enzyme
VTPETTFRGVFLTSNDPEATARFYRDVAGLALEAVGSEESYVYWKMDDGRIQLATHDAKAFADHSYPPRPDSNLTHLYFHIDDQNRFLDRLRALGVTEEHRDDVVVTVRDPDGRRALFGTA